MTLVIALAAGSVLGYLIRCWRPARRAAHWAQRQEMGTAAWWAAQPVLALALAVRLVSHPRQSVRNIRSWQEEQRGEPPRHDPGWAARRGAR